ncbi:molybdopterin-guanine dinucleotide biosynthesis protein B [Melghirimyces algeriensis]|uniref:Molybdopterin-guanine dinucleotide biosynthesis protein B n=1 Tax=Melghirimyces algeriensis TaxID=910412 RepID=A0A521AUZ3_9BACL|nr:molybdopterin-guanine dinucleotide biosynthesis protein B [Melghirimyces algeriensis]SMO38646.1 molybdopterin-guanine dinucleotide biosynthesis protein B [Melghirimyces algeriensis]
MDAKDIPPVVQIVGYSQTRKTTLLSRCVSQLSQEGWRVGTIKRHAGTLEMDEQGKDTWRHREAGANQVAITSDNQTVLIVPRSLQLDELIAYYREMDVVLVEGFKRASYPKLLMVGEKGHLSLIRELSNVRGIVSHKRITGTGLPSYLRDDVHGITEAVKQIVETDG